MRILVVDDDPDILRMCAKALRADGHEVVTCASGRLALSAALLELDVALCDLNLPDIDGLEVIRAIRASAPDLPVIVMSALEPREWRARSEEAGADHFLQKPVRLEELRDELAMAGLARTSLSVVVRDDDEAFRAHLTEVFARGGCRVRSAATAGEIIEGDPPPNLVVLDAASDGAEGVVRWAGKNHVHCFVLGARGKVNDRLLRLGASLVVNKPVNPDALLIQARFLAKR